jgi:hypothetical protein
MSDAPQNNEANDESALDAELNASIDSLKAGQTLEAQPQGQTGETGPADGGDAPTGETGSTGETSGDSQATGETGESELRIPNKGKFESDEAYEKRIELFDLVKRRKAATTPEAKAAISEDIKKAKGELRTLGAPEKIIQPKIEELKPGTEKSAEQLALEADQARLKELGGATKEDIKEVIQQERLTQEVASDIKNFVEKTKELSDPDVREVFFDFVDANYNWQGKSGKELKAVLGMAYETMFRPSETIQERVLKGAGVQEKVNAMQFPGGTGGKVEYSPEMKKSIEEMKAVGMSEEKAVELLSE